MNRKERSVVQKNPAQNPQTRIDTIIEQVPKLARIFNQHGMACVGCVFSTFHTLADAAAIYHVSVDALIRELADEYTSLYGSSADNESPS